MDMALLEILVCPICKGKLEFRKPEGELVCRFDKLAFPVVDGKPMLLVDSARDLREEEEA